MEQKTYILVAVIMPKVTADLEEKSKSFKNQFEKEI